MRIIKDNYGNRLYDKKGTIFLDLVKGQRPLRIAKINKTEGALEMYRDYGKHLFFKANAFGFNYELLVATKFKNIVLSTSEKEVFVIPIRFILDEGEFLFFKTQGFETQIFINLDKLKEFKL